MCFNWMRYGFLTNLIWFNQVNFDCGESHELEVDPHKWHQYTVLTLKLIRKLEIGVGCGGSELPNM